MKGTPFHGYGVALVGILAFNPSSSRWPVLAETRRTWPVRAVMQLTWHPVQPAIAGVLGDGRVFLHQRNDTPGSRLIAEQQDPTGPLQWCAGGRYLIFGAPESLRSWQTRAPADPADWMRLPEEVHSVAPHPKST